MTTSLKKLLLGEQGLLVIFAAAFVVVALTVPNFLTERNMLGLLQSVVTIGVVACTMMFCLASRDFDLSVGSTVAFSGMLPSWHRTRRARSCSAFWRLLPAVRSSASRTAS